MVSGVFDHVPEGQAFPYVTIGESTAADFSTKTEAGQEHTITIHAWSRERGRKETKQILARIYADETGLNRSLVANTLSNSDAFVKLPRDGRRQPYALRANGFSDGPVGTGRGD